ncbi:MAG: PFL family protein [Chlamydiae bacterium]|nr:MAG: PFL family protein [Chlamydiota bacterium]
MLFSPHEIQETIKMFSQEHLDIRTITMGISLRNCSTGSAKSACEKIYDKITKYAEKLVVTGETISQEYGIPIINKRIAVTPIALVAESSDANDYLCFAKILDKAAETTGVNFIGGFSALIEKGCTKGDRKLVNSIPEALAATQRVCSSLNLGTTRNGINMNAVRDIGEIIKKTAKLTADQNGIGCAKLVVFCNSPEDNPFMAGAFHGPGEPECQISVGVSGPGVIHSSIKNMKGASIDEIANRIKKTAFKITRMGQLVAEEASKRLNVPFGIIDLSLAPTPEIGDSVARILEEMGLEIVGAPGTTAALAILNDAVKKGGIMASSHVGGLSGAFIPVSEDEGMINAVEKGAISIEKLEAMTCVCSVGLDMIAIPGNTSASTISGIIADEMALGMVNNKTTAVRIIPVPRKNVGDKVSFGGLLGEAPIMRVSTFTCNEFISRGGRIPAPVHSFKN